MIKEVNKSQQLLDRRRKIVANGVGVFNTATVSHAKGAIITDEDGRELIDFAGGIGGGKCRALSTNRSKRYTRASGKIFTYKF